MHRKQPARSAESQRRMLEAALELIAEGGLNRATMVRIGERSGYSRGLVDYQFGSKAELVEEVIGLISRRWSEGLGSEPVGDLAPVEALSRVVISYMRELVRNPENFRALYVLDAESVSIAPEIRERLAHHDMLFRQRLRTWICLAQERAEIRSDVDADNAAIILAGLLRGVAFQWLLDPDALNPTELAMPILDLILASWGHPARLLRSKAPNEAPTKAKERP